MVRGRKPRPTSLMLIAGDQKSRINKDEPEPEDGVPTCPSANESVQAVWDYTVRQLLKMRTITMAERDVLLAYCQAVVMHQDASRLVDEEGLLVSTERGLIPHPAVRIAREAALQIRAYAGEFGLTPAARTRIKVADQQAPKQEQGASRLLSG
jgi:P27 family predicted phage terminase small subunit